MKKFAFLIIILFSLSVAGQTVYKTPSGKKYHAGNCRMVNNVSQKITLSQASDFGLTACKICNPPSSATSNFVAKAKSKGESNTVRCKGYTKSGSRCRHKTSIANGYCFQHNPD